MYQSAEALKMHCSMRHRAFCPVLLFLPAMPFGRSISSPTFSIARNVLRPSVPRQSPMPIESRTVYIYPQCIIFPHHCSQPTDQHHRLVEYTVQAQNVDRTIIRVMLSDVQHKSSSFFLVPWSAWTVGASHELSLFGSVFGH